MVDIIEVKEMLLEERPFIILVGGDEKIFHGRFFSTYADVREVAEKYVKEWGNGVYIFKATEYIFLEKNPIKVINYE